MSYPTEAVTRRKSQARDARKAAAEHRAKLKNQGLRRLEIWADGRAVTTIENARLYGETLSCTLNRLLGSEAHRVAELVELERRVGTRGPEQIDPQRLADDLLEFAAGAGHPTIGAAVEDLIARTVAMGGAGSE